MNITDAQQLFMLSRRARNLSAWTIRHYERGCREFVRRMGDMDIERITSRVVREYTTLRLRGGLSPYTVNIELRWLKAFLNFLCRERELDAVPDIELCKTELLTDTLNRQGWEEFINGFGSGFSGRRNRLAAMLMYGLGLRVGEVLNLKVSDVDLDNVLLAIRQSKSRTSRVLPLGYRLALTLGRYLRERKDLRPFTDQLLVSSGGRTWLYGGIRKAFANNRYVQGGHRVYPHMLRHSFATEWLRRGGDLESLRRMLGHSSYETTKRYVHLVTEDLSRAVYRFNPLDGQNENG